jgi:hypothetical protein
MSDRPAVSRLTDSPAIAVMTLFAALPRFTQKRIGGGVLQTVLTAEYVTPARPPGPSVATMVTAIAARDSASGNWIGEMSVHGIPMENNASLR